MLPDPLTDALLELSRTPVLLVASDYDGVIAPIVPDPNAAHPQRETAVALRSWQAAEDVVQDGMIKVWQRCATFKGPSDPLAWIRQIVRNTMIDAVRARPPEQPLQDEEGELTPEAQSAVNRLSASTVPTPDETLRSHEVERVFRRCFERFAAAHPEHALVLRWVVEDGLDNAEVEQLLDRKAQALEAIGRLLESYSYDQVLKRGFALVRNAAGDPVLAAAGIGPGQRLRLQFQDGELPVLTEGRPAASRRPGPAKGGSGDQGSLL